MRVKTKHVDTYDVNTCPPIFFKRNNVNILSIFLYYKSTNLIVTGCVSAEDFVVFHNFPLASVSRAPCSWIFEPAGSSWFGPSSPAAIFFIRAVVFAIFPKNRIFSLLQWDLFNILTFIIGISVTSRGLGGVPTCSPKLLRLLCVVTYANRTLFF